MENNLYTWDEIYERAMDMACGSLELRAKDNAREELGYIIKEAEGFDIESDECESAEEYIDVFLENSDKEYLFDEYGHFVKTVQI